MLAHIVTIYKHPFFFLSMFNLSLRLDVEFVVTRERESEFIYTLSVFLNCVFHLCCVEIYEHLFVVFAFCAAG